MKLSDDPVHLKVLERRNRRLGNGGEHPHPHVNGRRKCMTSEDA